MVPRLWDRGTHRYYLLDLSGNPAVHDALAGDGPWPYGCYDERQSSAPAARRSESARTGELSVDVSGGRIVYLDRYEEKVAAYDLESGAFLGAEPVAVPPGFQVAGRGLAGAGDGAVLESTADDSRGRLWGLLGFARGEVGRIELADRGFLGGWLPLDGHLLFKPAWNSQTDAATVVSSGENLAVDLRPRVLVGNAGIALSVVATDRYLAGFQLEYAPSSASPVFEPLGEPGSERLLGESWGTWLPPAAGRYLLRLTAWDRAGNRASVTRTVFWNGENDIANLTLDHRYISPFASPGVQDRLVLRYLVLRPANLEFEIQDEAGNVVRCLEVAADATGPRTTTWDGTDESGRPVPDGRYTLVYRGAPWVFVVDNTPPEVSFEVGELELEPESPPQDPAPGNGLVAHLSGEVTDANADRWSLSYRDVAGGGWVTLAERGGTLEARDFPLPVVAGGFLSGRELRLAARDLAGNSTEASRIRRRELLAVASALPLCGPEDQSVPCSLAERPPVDGLGDPGAPLHIEDGGKVSMGPGYTAFMVQSTVWGDVRGSLRLRYRRLAAGIPGPWQEGTLQVAPVDKGRRVAWREEVASGDERRVVPRSVDVALIPIYWDHPDLQTGLYEVQLTATNTDGQEILSPLLRALPQDPLLLETLGMDGDGVHLRVTNVTDNELTRVRLQRSGDGGESFTTISAVASALGPGEFAEVTLGCELLEPPGGLGVGWHLRAAADRPEGFAVSNLTGAPAIPRATIKPAFQRASCTAEPQAPAGLRFIPEDLLGPAPGAEGFTPGGVVRARVTVPADPTGAAVSRYELLVDGVVVGAISDPAPGTGSEITLDLSRLAEGSRTLSERYTFAPGQEGLLAACPRSWPLHVDREPPTVEIVSPAADAVLCPEDGVVPVQTDHSQDVVEQRLSLDGDVLGGWELDAGGLSPGPHTLTVEAWDGAGWAACAQTLVFLDEVPDGLPLEADPLIFSPVAPDGSPGQVAITSTAPVPGDFTAEIRPLAGGEPIASYAGHAERGELLELAWDGRDALGSQVPDGPYSLELRLTTACGATARALLPDQEAGRPEPIEVDATPPEVVLSSPVDGEQVWASVPLAGRITDLHLESWRVEVRAAEDCEDCWAAVAGGSRPAAALDEPLGAWGTSDRAPGSYLVRLVAEDGAGNTATAGPVTVELRERELARSFTAAPVLLSPNGDGVADEETFTAELVQDAVLTLEVQDAGGGLVRTLLDHQAFAAGEAALPVWDGTGGDGATVADGSYVFVLTAEDPASVLPPQVEQAAAVVDVSAPSVDIQQPAEGTLSGLPLAVVAAVDDPHLERWELSLAGLTGPSTGLASGSAPVTARQVALLQGLEDGSYRLILSATDAAGNHATLERSFEVDTVAPRVTFLDPEAGQILPRDMGRIGVRVRLEDDHLTTYQLAVAPGAQPAPGDFQTLAEGTEAPAGGVVEVAWDAAALADGPSTLRVTAGDGLGQESEVRLPVILDGSPPEAAITSPADGAVVSLPGEAQGSVQDPKLTRWRLTLRPADGAPLVLASGRDPVAAGRLGSLDPLPEDGEYDLVLEAWDAAGHHAEAWSHILVAAAPSPPEDLTATLAGRSDVALEWAPGPGPDPEAYVLIRDGAPIAEVTSTAYTDLAVPDGVHVYTARARNLAGVESADSEPASITVDGTLPTAQILDPLPGRRVSGQVVVHGTAARETAFAGYELRVRPVPDGAAQRIGGGTAQVLAGELGRWETSAVPDGPYRIELEARDDWGGAATDAVEVTVDNTPPSPPVLTEATAGAQDGDGVVNDVHAAWTLEPAPADLAGYYLYRNGRLANGAVVVIGDQSPYLLDQTQFDDHDLPDGRYVYSVTAADLAGNESPESNAIEVVIDTRRPHAVFSEPADGAEVGLTATLTAQVEDQDVMALDFEYRPAGGGSWSPVAGTLTAPPFTATFAAPAPGPYELRAVAADAVGPDPSPEIITVTATVPPPTPQAQVDGSIVRLSWTPLADPGVAQGIWVLRDGARVTGAPLAPDASAWDDTGLADGTYTYTLTVVDATGHETAPSQPVEATVFTPTFSFVSPVIETSATVLSGGGVHHGDLVTLERREAGGDFTAVATAQAEGDPDSPELSARFSFPGVELAPGLNVFRLLARTPAGDLSRTSRELNLVRTTAPAVPQDLAASVDQDQVTLTWASPQDPDVWRHAVVRDQGDALGETAAPHPYNSATHTLAASGGDPASWAAVVDGDPATGWTAEPLPSQATPAFWEWSWPEPVEARSLTLTWQPELQWIDLDLELEVGGVWLWWRSGLFHGPESTLSLPPGLELQGIRLRFEHLGETGEGGSCVPALEEVALTGVTRPPMPPFVDSGVPAGGHTYRVTALSRWGLASQEASVSALVGEDPPPAPAGVTATAGPGCGEVTIAWDAVTPPAGDLVAYHVLRGESAGGPFQLIASLPPAATSMVDRLLSPGTTYWYTVQAVAAFGDVLVEGAPADPVPAEPPCDAPPAPVIDIPTTAGHPLTLAEGTTPIGGSAWPGAQVTLLEDGEPVASTTAEPLSSTGSATPVEDYDPWDDWPVLNADGTLLAFADGGDATVVDLSSGEVRYLPVESGWIEEVALSPDGSLLAVVVEGDVSSTLELYNLQTGGSRPLLTAGVVESPLFSPDGRALAVSLEGRLALVGIDSGEVLGLLDDGYGSAYLEAFDPSGRRLLAWVEDTSGSAGWNPGELLVPLDGSDPRAVALPDDAELAADPFSPDGASLLLERSDTWDPEDMTLWTYDLASGALTQLSPAPGELAPAWLAPGTVAFLGMGAPGHWQLLARGPDGETRVLLDRLDDGLQDDLADGYWPPLRGTGGGWVVLPSYGVIHRLERRGGRFLVPSVALLPGDHLFVARQDALGGLTDSEAVEIDVPQAPRPDAAVQGVKALPAAPEPGQPVLIEAEVTNAGAAPLEPCEVVLLRLADGGAAVTESSWRVDLLPGETTTLSFRWEGLPAPGDSSWLLIADPGDLVTESDETNNEAALTVPVRDADTLEAAVSVDPDTVAPGQGMGIDVGLVAAGEPADVEVETVVEDAGGAHVASLDSRTVPALEGSLSFDLEWIVPEIAAGPYQVHTVATDASGRSAEASAAFQVVVPTAVAVSVAAERTRYAVGDLVGVSARVRNLSAGSLSSLRAAFEARPASGGAPVARSEVSLVTLASGAAITVPWPWETAGLAAGRYVLTCAVLDAAGEELARSAPFALELAAGPAAISGRLGVSPATLEPFGNVTLSAVLSNNDPDPVAGLGVALAIVDPATWTELARAERTVTVPGQGEAPVSATFPAADLALGSYLAVLLQEGAGGEQQLASAGFTVADLSPPVLTVLSPAPGPVCDRVEIAVQAVDALTGVVEVSYGVDGGEQRYPMEMDPLLADSVYRAVWELDAGQLGPHQLSVVARDRAGNVAGPVTWDIEAVQGGGQISVGAPDDGACTPGPVTIVFTFEGGQATELAATLNGEPIPSGTTITEEGAYTLEVTAADACGTQSTVTRHFLIDRGAPQVEIGGIPAREACSGDPVTPVITVSDPNLVSSEVLLNGEPFVSGTTVSEEGSYLLEVTATDACGHQSEASAAFAIETSPPVIEIAGVEDGACRQAPVTVTFTATDANLGEVTATLDGVPYESGTPITAEGQHTLVVTAGDTCGNQSIESLGFTIDNHPPEIEVTGVEEGACTTEDVALSFSADDDNLASVTASLDGAPYVAGTPVTGEGDHTLVVTAREACGRETQVDRSFTIDRTAPEIVIEGIGQGGTSTDPVTLSWTVTELHLEEEQALLDGDPVTSPVEVAGLGDHLLDVTARDCAGNEGSESLEFSIEASAPPPVTGSLNVSPADVLAGLPVELAAGLHNGGEYPVEGMTVRLLVEPAGGGDPREVISSELSLEPGGSGEVEATLETEEMAPGSYRVVLEGSGIYYGFAYRLELDEADLVVRAPAVPAVSGWGLGWLVLLLGLAGVWILRRTR